MPPKRKTAKAKAEPVDKKAKVAAAEDGIQAEGEHAKGDAESKVENDKEVVEEVKKKEEKKENKQAPVKRGRGRPKKK